VCVCLGALLWLWLLPSIDRKWISEWLNSASMNSAAPARRHLRASLSVYSHSPIWYAPARRHLQKNGEAIYLHGTNQQHPECQLEKILLVSPSEAEGERVEVDQRVVEQRQHEERRSSEKTPERGILKMTTEMCSGSEAGSYLRLIDLVHHSTLGLRVIKKEWKRMSEWLKSASMKSAAPARRHLQKNGEKVNLRKVC